MPILSIIIPVYNVQQYLDEAVESVIEQSFQDWECILVDDGSTDNSGILCDKWSRLDSRIKVIHQKNKGLSGARNSGMTIMSGKYVAFLDSDDVLLDSNLFTANVRILEEHNNLDFIQFPIKYINQDRETFNNHFCTFTGAEEILIAYQDGLISQNCWNKIFRASSIPQSIRFPEGLYFEDEWFILELFPYLTNAAINNIGRYGYRVRPGSITNGNKNPKLENDWILKRIHASEFAHKYEYLTPLYIKEYSLLIQELSYKAYHYGNHCINIHIKEIKDLLPSLKQIINNREYLSNSNFLKIILIKLFGIFPLKIYLSTIFITKRLRDR